MSQTERLYKHLKRCTRKGITPLEAWDKLGIYRLASRIVDVRKMCKRGEFVMREWADVQNRYGDKIRVARYRLVGE